MRVVSGKELTLEGGAQKRKENITLKSNDAKRRQRQTNYIRGVRAHVSSSFNLFAQM